MNPVTEQELLRKARTFEQDALAEDCLSETCSHLLKVLRALTPEQRQVIILRFVEGWGNADVAAARR